jgi:hypothetical protein
LVCALCSLAEMTKIIYCTWSNKKAACWLRKEDMSG